MTLIPPPRNLSSSPALEQESRVIGVIFKCPRLVGWLVIRAGDPIWRVLLPGEGGEGGVVRLVREG